MVKNIEHISSTRKRISFEIPAEALENEVQAALGRFKSQARIPGFRPGKAPMNLIEKRFIKDAESEALERAVPKYYGEAIREAAISPVSEPMLESGFSFTRGQSLTLTFALEVMPALEGLKYEGIKVKKLEPKVDDADIDETLERLRSERANVEPKDGPAEEGDLVVLDYESVEDAKTINDEVFKVGSDLMPRAFSDNLIGKKAGDKAEFKVAFPEDYYAKELAGAERTFKVTVKEVKRVALPEINEEFAKSLGFTEGVQALREHIGKRLNESQQEGISRLQRADIIRQLVEGHEFEVPESILSAELETLIARARTQNKMSTEAEPVDETILAEQLKPKATNHAKATVLIRMIGEKEQVAVTEDDMRRHVMELSMRVNLPPENIIKYYVSRDGSAEGLRREVYEEKVLDLVYGKAEFVPINAEGPAEAPQA